MRNVHKTWAWLSARGPTNLLFALLFAAWSGGCVSKSPGIHTDSRTKAECVPSINTVCPPSDKSQTVSVGEDFSEGEVKPFYEGVSTESMGSDQDARVIGEEVEEEIGKVGKDIPRYDIPIVINAKVEKWINYFQHRGRKFFAQWLARSEKYIPMMRRILRENGLPEDLIYLAMIESGFKPYAYSRAKASGPWQFIKRTGSRYGLRVTWWIDERRDPEKSTIAAAQHLKDLYDQFNSWYLAAAGYNAGAGKISRAIKRYSTEDFWEMSKYRYLKSETKNYVPKIIAAALIAKEPERYGFTDIVYDEPLEYDKVSVPKPTELSVIASTLDISYSLLTELNPELRRNITPPDMPHYELRVPKGLRSKFIVAYPEIRKKTVSGVRRHVVRRGDTLSTIAAKYGVNWHTLQSFNKLQSRRIHPGQQLAIPYWGDSRKSAPILPASYDTANRSSYRVRRGDTLWSISRRFDVSVSEIRKWNNISNPSSLRPGQKLQLYARNDPALLTASNADPSNGSNPEWTTYRVRSGDTLSHIAKRFRVSVKELLNWNNLQSHDLLRPGDTLKVRALNL